jgi:hypothetical protein
MGVQSMLLGTLVGVKAQSCQIFKFLSQQLDFPLNFFWWDWDLNSGLCASKPGVLLLEPHLQPILLRLFLK